MLISIAANNDLAPTRCGHFQPEIEISATSKGSALLRVFGIEGSIGGKGAIAGSSIIYTFKHPTLTKWIHEGHNPFVCVSGTADGDFFFGTFPGKVLRLTAQGATGALTTTLQRRFGRTFKNAPRKWVKCPRQELLPATSDRLAIAVCQFEFGAANGSFVGGDAEMAVLDGGFIAPYEKIHPSTYNKRLQACPIPPTRDGWVNGIMLTNRRLENTASLGAGTACRHLIGPTGMAADVESIVVGHDGRPPRRFSVGFHGTNWAGFEDLASFPCTTIQAGDSFRIVCRNKLDDYFTYSFNVKR